MIIGSLFLLILLGLVLTVVFWTIRLKISPMPTAKNTKAQLLAMLPEDLQGTIFELGSGWGTLAFSLARKYPHCKIVGFELSPIPFLVSKFFLFLLRYPNLNFIRRDFFKESLKEADLIVCYLYPEAMRRLQYQFEDQLKKEAIVATHTFALPDWTPYGIYEMDDLYKTKIYLYRKL